MNCPGCGKSLPEDAAECLSCGLIVAKWKAREETAAAPAPPAERPAASGAGKYIFLAAVLGAGFFMAYRWMSRSPKTASTAAPASSTTAGLDPEPYRETLQTIERAVYADGPPSLADADLIETQSAALTERLIPVFRMRSPDPLDRLETFTAAVGASAQALTFDPLVRRDWIRRWEETRLALFAPAPWFHPPLQVNEAAETPPLETAALELQRVDAQLAALIQSARTETADFGDRSVELNDLRKPEEGQRLERWRAWVPGWTDRVDQALAALPPPARVPAHLRDARGQLERVGLHLKAVPNPGPGVFLSPGDPAYSALYLPRRQSREGWLSQAEFWLSQFRQMVKTAQTGPA